MTDLDEMRWDDDYDDWRDDGPPREEPNCYQCCDGLHVKAPWWLRLIGRREVGCPSCNASRLQVAWWNARYRLPRLPLRRRPLGGHYDDEAPF